MGEAGESFDVGIEDDAWIGVGEAARLAGVDPSTIRRWADRGHVRARVTPGGTRQISRTSLRSGYQRETAARRTSASQSERPAGGPDPVGEHAPPEAVVPFLAAASTDWTRWTPRHLSRRRLEQLQAAIPDLRDALDDIAGAVDVELDNRDVDTDTIDLPWGRRNGGAG
jgi:excisionase family DNA binding protein